VLRDPAPGDRPDRVAGALADVLAPGGEIVLETYGSRLAADATAIEVPEAGDVCARDDFVYWGFTSEGLSRLGRIVGLDELEVVDELEIDGHPRILAVLRAAGGPRRAISGCPRPRTSPSRILRSGLT
jgi:hypothetical protein